MGNINRKIKQLNSKKDSIINMLYTCEQLDPIFRVYYDIKDFIFKIKRAFSYARVSWNVYDFDYTSVIQMTEYSLSRLQSQINDGWGSNSKKYVKIIKVMREYCNRISNHSDQYFYIIDETYKKHGYDLRNFKLNRKLPKPLSSDLRRAYKKVEQLEKRDLEQLTYMINKYMRHLWD